ncbi:MAG: acetylxylan esterase, partial [Mycobacteriales bacterium]
MLFDLPLEELRTYRPALEVPPDLAEFWSTTLAQARVAPLAATFTPVADSALRTVEVFDVGFVGFGGAPIAGWLLLPRDRSGPLPCIVEYIGYGGGRGLPHDWLDWSAFGYAHLVMDTRGQGSSWRSGVTRDVHPAGSAPHVPGFLTLGLPDRDDYYYRRLYVDAVRAVDAAREHPDVDPSRVVVCGGSQGGGLAIAAGALADGVSAVLTDVPFLAHFRRAVDIAGPPYAELLS